VLGRQTFQYGVASMHNENLATCLTDSAYKVANESVGFVVIMPNTMFNGHWQIDRVYHCLDAICDQIGLSHQASTKCPPLHALRGATTVQIDFVISPLLP